jgi:D-threo-aldose 1-dehydrogenase
MLVGHCTLLDPLALDDLLPACAQRGTSVIAAAVFGSGLLAEPRPAADARRHRPGRQAVRCNRWSMLDM